MITSLILLASLSATDGIFSNGFDGPCFVPGRKLIKTMSVSYGVYPPQRFFLDITDWNNVWGYNNTTAPQVPWPGVGGASPVMKGFPPDGFTCSKFTTPANIASFVGHFSNPSYIAGPNVTMKIVDRFGIMPTPGCIAANVPTDDSNLVSWKGTPNAPSSQCNLAPNTDYWVLEWFTEAACTNLNCIIGSVSYHN